MTYGKQQKSARLIQLVNVNQKMSKLIQTIYFISILKLILDDRDCHEKNETSPKVVKELQFLTDTYETLSK